MYNEERKERKVLVKDGSCFCKIDLEGVQMRRKIAAVLLAAAMALVYTGCSQSVSGESHEVISEAVQEETSSGNAQVTNTPENAQTEEVSGQAEELASAITVEKGSRIAVVAKSLKDDYWKNVRSGMRDAVDQVNKAYGYEGSDRITLTFEGPDNESDASDQINIIDAVLAENPAVLCLSAVDADSCAAQVQTAHENGIPVIAFDSGLNNSSADGVNGSDNAQIGTTAAEKMAEALGDQGKVAIVAHSEIGQSSQARVLAFQESMEKVPGIEVLDPVYDNGEEDLEDLVNGLLEDHEDLAGIFCTNGEVADVVLNQVDAEDGITLVGVDGTAAQQEAVNSGQELGFVAQNPYEIGYQTVMQALQTAFGEDAQSDGVSLVETQWIDGDNLEDFADSGYLM